LSPFFLDPGLWFELADEHDASYDYGTTLSQTHPDLLSQSVFPNPLQCFVGRNTRRPLFGLRVEAKSYGIACRASAAGANDEHAVFNFSQYQERECRDDHPSENRSLGRRHPFHSFNAVSDVNLFSYQLGVQVILYSYWDFVSCLSRARFAG
jgi:hypothetical protein